MRKKQIVSTVAAVLSVLLLLTACDSPAPLPVANSDKDSVHTQESQPASDIKIPEAMDIYEFSGYEWLVLDVQDDKMLILSNKILESREFNEFSPVISLEANWEYCTLRAYLNGEFYENTFTKSEKSRIIETEIQNKNNQWFGNDGGNDTLDKVFLLSLEEIVQYFGDSGQLSSRLSDVTWHIDDEYNDARIAQHVGGRYAQRDREDVYTIIDADAPWKWWLRSPGNYPNGAVWVTDTGTVLVSGETHHNYSSGVRPAMWISYS